MPATSELMYSPFSKAVFDDQHMVARGMHVPDEHDELDRTVIYPGVPYAFSASPPPPPRRAPLLGEHNALLDELSP